MSLHFSANQYEGVYRPWRLGAWEVPRNFPGRPRVRKGRTKIIADDRGHLLRGGARSQTSPWGPLTQQIDLRSISAAESRKEEIDLEKQKESDSDSEKRTVERHGKNAAVDGNKNLQRKHVKNTLKEEESIPVETNLQVTGSSVIGSPRIATPSGGGEESKCSSGTLTPASFRKVYKATPSPKDDVARGKHRNSNDGSRMSFHREKEAIIEEAAKLPPDTIEDALLPRDPSGDILEPEHSRAFAIRLVEHPGSTNCTKFTVIRPYTAPSPVPMETPLLSKRPTTSKVVRKIPEIEFALKWDLKNNFVSEDTEVLEEFVSKKNRSFREPQTPRSVTSVSSDDSGINIPKQAWGEGPDKNELALKLKALEKNPSTSRVSKVSNETLVEMESGYGSPASIRTKAKLPVVKPRNNSGNFNPTGAVMTPSRTTTPKTPESRPLSMINQERISIDSKCLSAKSNSIKDKLASRSSSSRHSRGEKKADSEIETNSPKPPERDPLEIMETLDSVFHKVPIRDTTGFSYYRPRQMEERQKEFKTLGIQTEGKPEEQPTTQYVMHNHALKDCGNQGRARNCVACEVRANVDQPRKYVSPQAGKMPFRFGRPEHHQPSNAARYVKQSEKYRTPLKLHHEAQRIWPINTLSSPFNNRPGYGQDQYPSHMRLRTTYGMAHQKPNKPQYTPLIKNLYK